MAIPYGTKYYIPITVDNTYVTENLSNFPYQIDLSSKLSSDSIFKSFIISASNISVYDPTSDSTRPRIVELNLTENFLVVSFDGSTNISEYKTYYVCVGPDVADSNSSLALSNSGYTNKWGLDEDTGSTTIYDTVGSNNGTGSSSYIGAEGVFGKCITYPVNGLSTRFNCGNVSVFNSASEFTIEFMAKFTGSSVSSNGYVVIKRQSSTSGFFIYYHGYDLSVFIMNGSSSEGNIDSSNFVLGQWHHIAAVYDGSQATNTDKLKIYVDGSPRVVSFVSNIPSSLPNLSSYNFAIGDDPASTYRVFNGSLDEVGIMSSLASQNFLVMRSNQFLEASFWSIGTGQIANNYFRIFNNGEWGNVTNTQIFIDGSWKQVKHQSAYIDSQWKDTA